MTEFLITPSDVGRVAIGSDMTSWTLKFHDEGKGYVFERDEDYRLFSSNGSGVWVDGTPDKLTHWRPRTLEATKVWWVVFTWPKKPEPHGICFPEYEEALAYEKELQAQLLARVYAEHWHGCEEGRFDTPESIGEES